MIADLRVAALILACIALVGIAALAVIAYADRRCKQWVEAGIRYRLPDDDGEPLPADWAYVEGSDQ